jgi:hypothetical protein
MGRMVLKNVLIPIVISNFPLSEILISLIKARECSNSGAQMS